MNGEEPQLDYAAPETLRSGRWGGVVRGFGVLLAAGGAVVTAIGFHGPDELPIILIGLAVVSFGILCAILGQILHTLEALRN